MEPVAGDAYRQEVRENHLGTKGAETVVRADTRTPRASCHWNPIGLCVLCCLFIWFWGVILSFNGEERFCRALQHSWCLTAVVLSSRLCPQTVESVLFLPDRVQCFSSVAKHVVIQPFVSYSFSFSNAEIFPPTLSFTDLSLSIPCFLKYVPVQPHTH